MTVGSKNLRVTFIALVAPAQTILKRQICYKVVFSNESANNNANNKIKIWKCKKPKGLLYIKRQDKPNNTWKRRQLWLRGNLSLISRIISLSLKLKTTKKSKIDPLNQTLKNHFFLKRKIHKGSPSSQLRKKLGNHKSQKLLPLLSKILNKPRDSRPNKLLQFNKNSKSSKRLLKRLFTKKICTRSICSIIKTMKAVLW